MGRYTVGGQRGYFYFISKDGKNLNAEQVLALLNNEVTPSVTTFDNFNKESLGVPLEPVRNPHINEEPDLQKRLSWAKLCRSAADENHNHSAYAEADEVVRDLERQLRALTKPAVVMRGDGDKPLTAERKAQLKGTLFECCETENEVTARHFELMS